MPCVFFCGFPAQVFTPEGGLYRGLCVFTEDGLYRSVCVFTEEGENLNDPDIFGDRIADGYVDYLTGDTEPHENFNNSSAKL